MTTTTAPTVRERRSRRRLGILAGIAGGLLLLGGTTYALWSDSALQAGGTITNGNLDVEPLGSTTYWDVSLDRTDATVTAPVTGRAAHAIASLAGYSIVPGDVLEAEYGFVVALSGDNLVANLTASLPTGTTPPAGVTFTAQAYYLVGTTWTAVGTPSAIVPGVSTPVSLGNFQAVNQLNGAVDSGAIPILALETTTGATAPNISVVVRATFDAATTGRTSVQATSALGNVTVAVNQIRTAGVGNFQ